ncbi:unnamed protein product [Protopolystoma xenopodis]|uniref:Potassium channel domain-containing protein n=1 Tax=Protopolystoma xenopodis TaxID=117903 RepID=A0A3S5CKN2_9PLAT|nr:unnamed protein product [Protopolystoma xenopodis]
MSLFSPACLVFVPQIGWLDALAKATGEPFNENATTVYTTGGPSIRSKYITALYFTVTTLTSIGFGNVAPNTNAEKIFTIIAMMLGCEFRIWSQKLVQFCDYSPDVLIFLYTNRTRISYLKSEVSLEGKRSYLRSYMKNMGDVLALFHLRLLRN